MRLIISFTKNRQLIMLSLIVALGALLRLYGLEIQSLGNDELSSWFRSHYASLTEVVNLGVRPDVHPPGYQIFLFFVERYVGDSEAILRLPSAIAGIFSIVAICLVGQQLYSYREGLIAAALMAIMWCPIYYSQEVRAYSILLLFTLLAAYFWIEIVKWLGAGKKVSPYVALAYVITAVIAAYSHYYGVYFIVLQGLLAALILRKRGQAILSLFAIYGLILLAYVPWLPSMVSQLSSKHADWIVKPDYTAVSAYLRFLFSYSDTLLYIVLILYGYLFLINVYTAIRRRYKKQVEPVPPFISLINFPTRLLTIWLIVPFAVVYSISILVKPILTDRNLIILLPAAYLLLARAITKLPVGRWGHALLTISIIGIFLYNLLFGIHYYSRPSKAQFREAVRLVVEEAHLYEDAAIIGYVWNPNYLNYYFKKNGSAQRVGIVAGQKEDIPILSEYIQTKKPAYIWYVSADIEPAPEFVEFLEQTFTLISTTPFINANAWLFENR